MDADDMKKTHPMIGATLALLLASLACTIEIGAPPTQPDAATAVAMTLTAVALQHPATHPGLQPAQPSQAAPANPTAPPPQPTIQPSAIPPSTVPPTTVSVPCDRARFVKDMSFPDGAKVQAGQTFEKTWKLKNDGSCPWTSAYVLIFDHGEQMGAPAFINFTAASIAPGKNVDVSVTLTAPSKPGAYQGFFMLKNSTGRKFGIGDNADQAFWVKIVVEAPPGPSVHKSGLLEIPQTWSVDLDSGSLGPASGAEIKFQAKTDVDLNLVFFGPAKLFTRQPSFEDCQNAQMDSPTVPASSLSLGTFFCYVTDQGRFGYLEYAGSDTTPGAGKLYLEFTTWNKP